MSSAWAYKPFFDEIIADTVGCTKQKAMVNALYVYANVVVHRTATPEDIQAFFDEHLASHGRLLQVRITEIPT
jgi:(2Fe-2S) ferredoxin